VSVTTLYLRLQNWCHYTRGALLASGDLCTLPSHLCLHLRSRGLRLARTGVLLCTTSRSVVCLMVGCHHSQRRDRTSRTSRRSQNGSAARSRPPGGGGDRGTGPPPLPAGGGAVPGQKPGSKVKLHPPGRRSGIPKLQRSSPYRGGRERRSQSGTGRNSRGRPVRLDFALAAYGPRSYGPGPQATGRSGEIEEKKKCATAD